MLPRWHIILGAIFTICLASIFPEISLLGLFLIFLASFLIDFDHYLSSCMSKGKVISLKESFKYYDLDGKKARLEKKKGIFRRGDFHLFHTLEFHAVVLVLGFFWQGFFYIFIGMVFHSFVDIVSIWSEGYLYRREFFLANWLATQTQIYKQKHLVRGKKK